MYVAIIRMEGDIMNKIKQALKIKDIRYRLYYMIAVLVLVRIGSQIPVPGVDRAYLQECAGRCSWIPEYIYRWFF